MIKGSRPLVAALVAMTLVAAACGDDDDDATPAEEAEEAVEDAASSVAQAADEVADTVEDAVDSAESTVEEAMTEDSATEGTEADAPAATSGDSLVIWADDLKIEPLQEVAPAFTEATGVEVQVELVPFEDLREQVTQAAPAGEGPDIFVGAHDWTGELAANGIIDSVDVSSKEDQFLEQALQVFNLEGQNYAVPYVTEAIAMYRNTDFAPDAPATWADVTSTCDEAAPPNCVVVAGGGTTPDAYHEYPFISGYGGYVFAFDEATGFDPSDVGLDTPEAIEGAAFLESLVSDGYVPSTDYDTAKNLFLEGDAAYWITGPWELGTLRDQDTVNWDVSTIPDTEVGPSQPFVGAQGFFLSSFSENALLAQSFLLDFLATDDTMQALYDADPRGTAWVSVQEGLADDPQVQVFGEAVASGVPMPNIPQMGQVWTPLGENLLLLRNGEQGAEATMTTAADNVRSAITG